MGPGPTDSVNPSTITDKGLFNRVERCDTGICTQQFPVENRVLDETTLCTNGTQKEWITAGVSAAVAPAVADLTVLDSRLGGYCFGTLSQCRVELEELDAAAGGPALDGDVDLLSALANETRYKIVRILHAADDELCVCEFAPLLDVSDSAISHALSQLTNAGLLVRRKDGKWRKYRATIRTNALLVALDGSRKL